jgi:hypothetical protein
VTRRHPWTPLPDPWRRDFNYVWRRLNEALEVAAGVTFNPEHVELLVDSLSQVRRPLAAWESFLADLYPRSKEEK